jgi:hypothetical protein
MMAMTKIAIIAAGAAALLRGSCASNEATYSGWRIAMGMSSIFI